MKLFFSFLVSLLLLVGCMRAFAYDYSVDLTDHELERLKNIGRKVKIIGESRNGGILLSGLYQKVQSYVHSPIYNMTDEEFNNMSNDRKKGLYFILLFYGFVDDYIGYSANSISFGEFGKDQQQWCESFYYKNDSKKDICPKPYCKIPCSGGEKGDVYFCYNEGDCQKRVVGLYGTNNEIIKDTNDIDRWCRIKKYRDTQFCG